MAGVIFKSWKAPNNQTEEREMSEQVFVFICEECNQEFESDWPDEEARKEFSENFPGQDFSEAAVVCDECFGRLMAGT